MSMLFQKIQILTFEIRKRKFSEIAKAVGLFFKKQKLIEMALLKLSLQREEKWYVVIHGAVHEKGEKVSVFSEISQEKISKEK